MPQYVPVDEKHPTEPINFYGFSKLEIERFLPWYGKLKGINWIALRYFNAVGYDADGDVKGLEKNPQNLLPIVMETAKGIRAGMKIFGKDYDTVDGTCVRDYIHVSDLASAHWLALKYLAEGGQSQTLNLGTGKGISVLEMVQMAEKIIGHAINYDFADRRAGDPGLLLASSDVANAVLGWKPIHSDLENMIRTTWAMYQK
jgi:UDP-glucose 4-epimerase